MINRLRTMWVGANPIFQIVVGTLAAAIVGAASGLALGVYGTSVLDILGRVPLPTEITDHPLRAALGVFVGVGIVGAVYVTFVNDGRKR